MRQEYSTGILIIKAGVQLSGNRKLIIMGILMGIATGTDRYSYIAIVTNVRSFPVRNGIN
jgi:hypothetical protein